MLPLIVLVLMDILILTVPVKPVDINVIPVNSKKITVRYVNLEVLEDLLLSLNVNAYLDTLKSEYYIVLNVNILVRLVKPLLQTVYLVYLPPNRDTPLMTVTVSIVTTEMVPITVKTVYGNVRPVETNLINVSNVMEKTESYLLVTVKPDISD